MVNVMLGTNRKQGYLSTQNSIAKDENAQKEDDLRSCNKIHRE